MWGPAWLPDGRAGGFVFAAGRCRLTPARRGGLVIQEKFLRIVPLHQGDAGAVATHAPFPQGTRESSSHTDWK